MFGVVGAFGIAKVFAEQVDEATMTQIKNLVDSELSHESTVCVMPDCHAGKGCVVGLTMSITDKVCPNLVGVDIGCGMLVVSLGTQHRLNLDFNKLDEVIRERVPSGFEIHEKANGRLWYFDDLYCRDYVDIQRAEKSIGTLGGGNHFIEVAKAEEDDEVFLIIHSGSRKFGLEVAAHYQEEAYISDVHVDLAWLEGVHKDNYLHDMKIAQFYANSNRAAIAKSIIHGMGWEKHLYNFTTTHNYVDFERNILRKGAVSASAGEMLLIPLNMRDGSLLCEGKGNKDWNYSAPHGAGRILSRTQAKKKLSLEEYRQSMEGIHSTCINEGTIDESPMAYKDSKMIERLIEPTAKVLKHLKPLYNFKAGGN